MSVNIQLEWTPNPSTLKYVVDTALLPRGAMNFVSKDVAAEKSPLAQRLFDIKGVMAVMLGTNFVTVTKGDEGEWDELNDGVMLALDKHLTDGEAVVKPEVLEAWTAAAAVTLGSGGAMSSAFARSSTPRFVRRWRWTVATSPSIASRTASCTCTCRAAAPVARRRRRPCAWASRPASRKRSPRSSRSSRSDDFLQ